MLQVFTLSYPESKRQGPKIMVLFTNFSKYEKEDDDGDFSFDEDEEETKETQGPASSEYTNHQEETKDPQKSISDVVG